jgi:hypothetical protein
LVPNAFEHLVTGNVENVQFYNRIAPWCLNVTDAKVCADRLVDWEKRKRFHVQRGQANFVPMYSFWERPILCYESVASLRSFPPQHHQPPVPYTAAQSSSAE